MESIPLVTFGQILGLIFILSEGPQTATRCLTITRRSFESMIVWGRYAGLQSEFKKPRLSRTTRKCHEVN
jgi:hypothetical protein